ncbi:MAG: hypothetical protein BRD50_02295 [Bacteroidetes bacterium SW_11_45_7]|nr:MAG: hypothetical protein BRD50_02295 [Bacteroidetes bacterium SW_11_45_7]
MTDTLFREDSATNTSYQSATKQFTPYSSGSYYIGFHGYSAPDKSRLFIDDVEIQRISQKCPMPFKSYILQLSFFNGRH